MQEGMLLHSVYDDKLAYFEQVRYHIKGQLNIEAFNKSWNSIISRHDIFRTIFVHEKVPQPIQIVFKKRELDIPFEDISSSSLDEQESILLNKVEADRAIPFNLSKDMLMRISLFKLADDSFEIIWSFHHILMDGWSLGLIQEEFFQTYAAFSKNTQPVLQPVMPFAEYIKYLKEVDQTKSIEFWTDYLKDFKRQSSVPVSANDNDGAYQPGEYFFELSKDDTKSLEKLAQDHQVTTGVLFQCLWAVYLNSFNTQNNGKLDVVYGVTVSGRPPEIRNVESIIGLFINTVPQRFTANLNDSFVDYLQNSQKNLAESKSFHFTSLSEIQALSELKQHLFDHVFVFENYPFEETSEEDMQSIGIAIDHFEHFDFTNYNFTFQMVPSDQFGFKFLYNKNNYSNDFFKWLERSIRFSIKKILNDTNISLNKLILQSPKSEAQLIPLNSSDEFGVILDEDQNLSPVGVLGDLYTCNGENNLDKIQPKGLKAISVGNSIQTFDSVIDYEKTLEDKGYLVQPKLALKSILITASFTVDLLSTSLDWWMKTFSLPYTTNLSSYNQIFQQLSDSNSELNNNSNNNDINLIMIRLHDWLRDSPEASIEEQKLLILKNKEYLISLLQGYQNAAKLFISFLPYNSSEIPTELNRFLKENTVALSKDINEIPGISLLNLENAFGDYGLTTGFDEKQNNLGHIPYSENGFNCIGAKTSRSICSYLLPAFKVIVLDCDNTLWQGVVGEDGVQGIKITENYKLFQEFILNKYHSGFLLAIASKNNEENVWEAFEKNSDMILKKEHFASAKINWNVKSDNIKDIAKDLNLGLSSFIFLDDSAMECSEVMQACPEVLTIKFPEKAQNIADYCDQLWAFDQFRVTDEDRKRNEMVKADVIRNDSEKQSTSPNDFTENLNLSVEICSLQKDSPKESWERASQLTYRTNQFNLSTIRRTEKEMIELLNDGYQVWLVKASDRFGQYGWVGVVIFKVNDTELVIDSYMLSCRVLARKVEHAIFSALKNQSSNLNVTSIACTYLPTDKNLPMKKFLAEFNWDENKAECLKISIDRIPDIEAYITLNYLDAYPIVKKEMVETVNITESSVSDISAKHKIYFSLTNESKLNHHAYYKALFASNIKSLADLPYQEIVSRELESEYVSPETKTEISLSIFWQELLKIDRVGVIDNFFQLGGHSLLATRLLSRVYKDFEVNISLKDFFDNATIRKFAELIHSKQSNYETIQRVERQTHYELSYAQRRLWAVQNMDEESFAYNTPSNYLIKGELNIKHLRESFLAIFEKQSSLRTRFELVDGTPRQFIIDDVASAFEVIHYDDLGIDDLKRYLSEQGEIVFDLSKGPLIRFLLIEINSKEFVLHINMHHIISDGWSMELLESEFLTIYDALKSGKSDFKPEPLTLEYIDYANWHNSKIHNSDNVLRDYWHHKLEGELPILNYPLDKKRPIIQTHRGQINSYQFDKSFLANLQKVAKTLKVSRFAVLNTIVKLYLYKMTGQKDLVIGVPVSGRSHPDFQNQIGFFVNTIVLRDQLDTNESCEFLMNQVQDTLTSAYDHQDYPLNLLVDELGLDRDLSRSPIIDIFLSYQKLEQDIAEIEQKHQLQITDYKVNAEISRFDLTFHFQESEDSLELFITYNTDLFLNSSIDFAFNSLQQLGRVVLEKPTLALREVSILSHEDKNQLLTIGNHFDSTEQVSTENHIFSVFQDITQKNEDRIAVKYKSKEISYGELMDTVNRMAFQLSSVHQIKKGDVVAVLMPKSDNSIIALLSLIKLGAIYLPIDAKYPAKRIEYILENSKASICLVSESSKKDQLKTISNNSLLLIDMDSFDLNQDDQYEYIKNVFNGEDSAYLIYTSGSTGNPKGVLLKHHGFVNMCMDQIETFSVEAGDQVIWFASAAFDASLSEIFMTLLKGASLCIPSEDDIQDISKFETFIDTHKINIMTLPPVYLHQLDKNILSNVKTLITAGESPILEDVKNLYKQLNYFNAYGPTETSVCATMNKIETISDDLPISIGKPIKGLSIYILDQDRELVPNGVTGEIAISGIGLAKAYLNEIEMTSSKFLNVAALGNQKVYLTGDIGYWDINEELVFVSRKDNQVKIRGHRIELNEINNAFLDLKFTTEAETLVIKTTGDARLVTFILNDSDIQTKDSSDYKLELSDYLPAYMVPHQIYTIKEFPMTSNGKLDTAELQTYALKYFDANKLVKPISKMEILLFSLVKEVLRLEQFSIDESFFDLGGDSIKAIQLVSKIRSQGYQLSSKDIFIHPTIESLSTYLEKRQKSLGGDVSCDDAGGNVLLSPIQSWFFNTFKSEAHHFNHSELFFAEKKLDIEALKHAMKYLVDMHVLLTAKVIYNNELPELFISKEAFELPLMIKNVDATTFNQELLNDQSSLNLSTGPLWQIVLYHCDDGDRLLMCFHHLIIDGVSWRMILEDFNSSYQKSIQKQRLSVVSNQGFKNWTKALHTYSQSEAILKEIPYWNQLSDQNYSYLKVDHETSQQQVKYIKSVNIKLSKQNTSLIVNNLLPELKATINELLISCLAIALCEYRHQSETLIMMEGHGRDEDLEGTHDLSHVVGWFTNAYPLLITSKGESLNEIITHNRTTLENTPRNGIGYNILKYITSLYQDIKHLNEYKPTISFNYLGNYEEDSLFDFMQVDKNSPDYSVSKESLILHKLNINGFIRNGTLEFYFAYNSKEFNEETIALIANRFLNELTNSSIQNEYKS